MISWTNSWLVVCKGNPTARETETKWFAAGSRAQEPSPLRRERVHISRLPNDVERSALCVVRQALSAHLQITTAGLLKSGTIA